MILCTNESPCLKKKILPCNLPEYLIDDMRNKGAMSFAFFPLCSFFLVSSQSVSAIILNKLLGRPCKSLKLKSLANWKVILIVNQTLAFVRLILSIQLRMSNYCLVVVIVAYLDLFSVNSASWNPLNPNNNVQSTDWHIHFTQVDCFPPILIWMSRDEKKGYFLILHPGLHWNVTFNYWPGVNAIAS